MSKWAPQNEEEQRRAEALAAAARKAGEDAVLATADTAKRTGEGQAETENDWTVVSYRTRKTEKKRPLARQLTHTVTCERTTIPKATTLDKSNFLHSVDYRPKDTAPTNWEFTMPPPGMVFTGHRDAHGKLLSLSHDTKEDEDEDTSPGSDKMIGEDGEDGEAVTVDRPVMKKRKRTKWKKRGGKRRG